MIRSPELDEFVSDEGCAGTRCAQYYEVSNLFFPYNELGYRAQTWLERNLPGWTGWAIRVRVVSQNGKLISRTVFIGQSKDSNLIVMFHVRQMEEPRVDECDAPEITKHPGYSVTRLPRYHTLSVALKPDASSTYVGRAFDLNIDCLRTPNACSRADAIAPRASEDFFADAKWKAMHQDDVERVWRECEKHPRNVYSGNAMNRVPVPDGLR